jgi:CTP synthase
MPRKYIFISGGVISGLGKGIITSSLSLLLKDKGYKVAPVKVDMYLNMDAGTLRPQEHGETFVLDSGLETDQDLGNYERFLGENLPRENYITTGQIYAEVLRKERCFEYEGTTVEAIPHVTDEIIRRIKLAGEVMDADVVIVELGGTITLQEIQNRIFIEAARIMKLKKPRDVVHIHVTYLPFVKSVGELKSKPAQTSVYILNSMGIQPDFVVARSEVALDKKRMDKVALFCNIFPEDLILEPDLGTVYKVPEELAKQKTIEKLCRKLGLRSKVESEILPIWNKFTTSLVRAKEGFTVAIAAKYFKTGDFGLTDSYVSVVESLKHAGAKLGVKVNIRWMDTEGLDEVGEEVFAKTFTGVSGLIVPQGWGSRGVEGKIRTAKYAREDKIPYLGLCFGMQMAVVEFARDVLGLKGANSEEADAKTRYPVVHIMPGQAEYLAKRQYGGTIRLGAWPCVAMPGTRLDGAYKKYGSIKDAPWYHSERVKDKYGREKIRREGLVVVYERHRHRYEFNNDYRGQFEKAGLSVSGVSPDGKLVEAIEIPNHPFFIGTQFHPEYISRPLTPHPLFLAFLEAVINKEKIPPAGSR